MDVTAAPSDIKSRLLYRMTFHWDSDDSAALGMPRTSTARQSRKQPAQQQHATDTAFLVAEEE